MRRLLCLLPLVFLMQFAHADIVGDSLKYTDGAQPLAGELFRNKDYPDARGGILIAHQWMGISDHEREAARKLAAQGFIVLCADIYGAGIRPTTPQAAGAESLKYKANRGLTRTRMQAALDALRSQGQIPAGRPIIAVGYCFGGMCVLEMARAGQTVDAVVSVHGTLAAGLDESRPIKSRVLALHGADDPYVPPAEVKGFKEEMRDRGANLSFVAYPDAVHAFTDRALSTDNSKGAAYNPQAADAAWSELLKLLDSIAPAHK